MSEFVKLINVYKKGGKGITSFSVYFGKIKYPNREKLPFIFKYFSDIHYGNNCKLIGENCLGDYSD